MKAKILFTLVLLWLPFLLINDFYPLFRFGMFAEPVKKNMPQELFILYFSNKKGIINQFETYVLGLDASVLNYLARKYYYQKKLDEFGRKLQKSYQKIPDNPYELKEWYLYRVLVFAEKRDSFLVARYENK